MQSLIRRSLMRLIGSGASERRCTRPSRARGATSAFGNCEGWTGMLVALKAWVEHGINLRDGFYA